MTIKSEIDNSLNTIIRTVTGEMRAAEIYSEFDKSLTHPDFRKNMNVVWDMTNADVRAASTNEVLDVVAHIGNNIANRGESYKIAIVASTEMSFVMSKMFETYGEQLPVSIHVFNALEDALTWIGEEQTRPI